MMKLITIPSNGTASIVHACREGLHECHLTSAISFEVQSGCRNMHYRTMRFSNFLHTKLLEWGSRSNQFSTQKLLEELNGYSTAYISERSKFLNKDLVYLTLQSSRRRTTSQKLMDTWLQNTQTKVFFLRRDSKQQTEW